MDALFTLLSLAGMLAVFALLAVVAGAESRDGFDRTGRGPGFRHDAAGQGHLFR